MLSAFVRVEKLAKFVVFSVGANYNYYHTLYNYVIAKSYTYCVLNFGGAVIAGYPSAAANYFAVSFLMMNMFWCF